MSISWQIVTVEGVGELTRPSLAFSPSGQPAIAFYSSWKQALRFATLNNVGTWTIGNVDSVSDDCFPSLAFRFGRPAISYGVLSANELRYAHFRGWNVPWSIESVAPGGSTSSLAFDSASGRVSATMSRTAKRSDTLKIQRLPPGSASPWTRIQIAASSIHWPS